MAKSIKVTFEYEKDTPNKVRFDEQRADGAKPIIGKLYLSKEQHEELGKPEKVAITLVAA